MVLGYENVKHLPAENAKDEPCRLVHPVVGGLLILCFPFFTGTQIRAYQVNMLLGGTVQWLLQLDDLPNR